MANIGKEAGSFLEGLGSFLGLGLGSEKSGTSSQRLIMRPEDEAALRAASGGYQAGVGNLLEQLQQTRAGLAGMPGAGQRFQYTGAADPVTRAIAAQGQQDLLAQAAGARRQLMRQNRPDVTGPLASILSMQTQLQQNPLMGQALQQQFARQLSQAQLQEQQLQNEIRNLFGRAQLETMLGTTGLGAQGNLVDMLANLAKLGATTESKTEQESGGFLSKIFG
jgi:hypothetical protein